ncbi:unnamed protein product, partial [Amoebophrya sp. A25]|eukprot:GSA25T00018982001.1
MCLFAVRLATKNYRTSLNFMKSLLNFKPIVRTNIRRPFF